MLKYRHCAVISMDESTDQGSSSDQGVLAHSVGCLHLLCDVRPSANDRVAVFSYALDQGDAAHC